MMLLECCSSPADVRPEDAVQLALARTSSKRLFLAEVSLNPPNLRRYYVLEQRGEGLATVTSALADATHAELFVRQLHEAREVVDGRCDAMASKWELAWFRVGDELKVWSRNRRLSIIADPQWVQVYRRSRLMGGSETTFDVAKVVAVHVSVSPSWVRHDVELVTANARRYSIAHKVDRTTWLDVTYDGLDLLVDTSWATHLAHALASVLGVPATSYVL